MGTRTMTDVEFEERCLAWLDNVTRTGEAIVVTKGGKPLVRIVAVEEPPSLRGSVVRGDDLLDPVDERWDAAD